MACELGYMALNGDPFGAVAAQAGFDYDDRAGGEEAPRGTRAEWVGA
jgi:hypothetical protein